MRFERKSVFKRRRTMFRPAEVLRDGWMIPSNVYFACYSGALSLNVHTLERSGVIPVCAAATVRQKTSKRTTDGRVERRIGKEGKEGKEGEPRRKRGTGKMKERKITRLDGDFCLCSVRQTLPPSRMERFSSSLGHQQQPNPAYTDLEAATLVSVGGKLGSTSKNRYQADPKAFISGFISDEQ